MCKKKITEKELINRKNKHFSKSIMINLLLGNSKNIFILKGLKNCTLYVFYYHNAIFKKYLPISQYLWQLLVLRFLCNKSGNFKF